MKRLFLYGCIWLPGALAAIGFVMSSATSSEVADGRLSFTEGSQALTPWVWIPGFLLMPAFLLGIVLLFRTKGSSLVHLCASIGLVFAWIGYVDSGNALKRPPVSGQAAAPEHPLPASPHSPADDHNTGN